jgi:hypothetical protein
MYFNLKKKKFQPKIHNFYAKKIFKMVAMCGSNIFKYLLWTKNAMTDCIYVTRIVRRGANVHIYQQTFIMTGFDGKCA